MRRLGLFIILSVILGSFVFSGVASATPKVGVLDTYVRTWNAATNGKISVSGGYNHVSLSFSVEWHGDYGAALAGAIGYSYDSDSDILATSRLLQIRVKEYDGLEKDVKYDTDAYWRGRLNIVKKGNIGYEIYGKFHAYIKENVHHVLWFDSSRILIDRDIELWGLVSKWNIV